MKTKKSLRSFLLLAAAASLVTSAAHAQNRTIYWDGINSSWGTTASWSTAFNSAGSNPNPAPGAFDLSVFNITTVNNAQTVTLDANRSTFGMVFNNTDTTAITANASGTANRTLTLDTSGITINSGAGAVTLGNGGTNGQALLSLAAGAQTWTNHSPNNFTINNTAATFTRAAGATLIFNQVGAGAFAIDGTELPNDATGIVGPWALFGTGSSQRYAFNDGSAIATYTGGTVAADAEAFTSDTTNYDFSTTGTTTLTTNRTAHTARYTGTGNTIDLGASDANTLTLNGLMAVGASGSVTIQRSGTSTGTLVVGSSSDLVIAGTQNVNISAPISGVGALTYAGSGTLTLSGANTYSGATSVGAGTLIVDGTSILPTTTLVNIGNVAGTTFQINNDTTVGNLSCTGILGTVALQGNTLTFGNASATAFNGQFTGTTGSGLIKQGNGTMTWGNVTKIPGTLTINGGTILVSQGKLSGGTVTLNANNAVLSITAGTPPLTSGLPETTISNPIVLGSSVTTTGAGVYTAGAGKWNFTGGITGADGVTQTLKFDSRGGGTVGGDRTSTQFSGVIADGASGTLNLSFNITPQSSSTASNQHPTNVSISAINTFTGSLTAIRANTGATSWLTIGGERWTNGGFGLNTPIYGREGIGYLGGSSGGNYAGAINFNSTANNIVNLNYFSSANQTWSGVIGGSGASGAIVKEGSGTLTLTNANLYNSLTTIGGGTLALGFDTTTTNILPSTTPLHMGLGTIYDPISANADIIMSGGGGGGTLLLGGAAASATQTVASLTTAVNTANKIVVNADRTLTVTSPTVTIGANSALNFNTAAGANNGATVGTSVVVFDAVPTAFSTGFTVTDAGGFGLATVNGSNQVIRDTTTTLLTASGATSDTDYRIDNNAGGSAAAGSSNLAITASQSAKSITVDTTTASGTLSLDSAVVLSTNVWNFGGNGSNTYLISGSADGAGLGAVASGNTISINNFNTGTVTFDSPILAFGTNPLVVGGTGTVALAEVNTYTGATTINSGTLQISGSGALNSGTYAGAISINGGSILQYSSSFNQTLTGVISGPGGVTKDTDDASVLSLNATNIYTGPTRVNAGTLRAGAAGGGQAFGGGSAVTLADTAGVTLNLNNFSQTIGSLAGGGSTGGEVTLGTGTLTTGGNNTSTTFGGVISGSSGGLTKSGSGTMTLSGENTYGGATIINGGTLALGAANALPSTAVTIGAATLNAATFADTVGTLDVTSTATINLGSGAALAFADSSAVDWTGGTLNITGTLGATSLRFGTTSGGLTPSQLAVISVNNAGLGTYSLDANGYLVVGGGGGSAYDTWKAANAPGSNPGDDTDGDGVTNAVEFVLGGTSLTNDLDKLPVVDASSTNLTFTFLRDVDSIDPKTALFIETSTDLVTWDSAPSPYTVGSNTAGSTAGVTVQEDTPTGFDTITLTVPKGLDPKKFARLRLQITP